MLMTVVIIWLLFNALFAGTLIWNRVIKPQHTDGEKSAHRAKESFQRPWAAGS
jgi:hypothetical protein